MKKFYTQFAALLFVSIVSAQPCPDSLYLTSQAQIDSFQILYPNCTEIEGGVYISGGDITNLNGLSVLTSVGGILYIGSNAALTSLTGLDNLPSVGGGLSIVDNDALNNLTGLDNLTSVGGWLSIMYNAALNSLAGLDNLTSVGEFLYIHSNAAITSLTGLDNMTSVGGSLYINDNAVLSSLTGLDNINAESIEDLEIYDNQWLSGCAILSICNYLANPNGTISIYNNATGCGSPEEVQDSCEANGVNIDEQFIADKLLIYPNPSNSSITIELPTTLLNNIFLTLSNINGQEIIRRQIKEPKTEIDISHLPTGIYIVKVCNDKNVMVQKVIKQ